MIIKVVWKKTFCQNSDFFGYCFIKNDSVFMYLLYIYKLIFYKLYLQTSPPIF